MLCGSASFKVLHALHISFGSARLDPKELERMLDLVTVGTIADLSPLIGENRYYVREGLTLIAIGQRTGLRALAAISGCTGVSDSSVVAYRLAPRLNAAGRLAYPSPPLRLLLTDDEGEAMSLAQTLHELNGARQDVERQILDEAVQCVESGGEPPPVIVLAGNGWHEGVVGIVAARLVERYHRPAILLGLREGVAKGSGRSIAKYDIMEALTACADHLTVYGGHPQAVGLTLEAERLEQFRCDIERHAGGALRPCDLVPAYRADAVLRGEDLNADTAVALASLGPFGSGNLRPRLLVVGAEIQQAETTRDGSHLRCAVRVDGVRARGIAFGMGNHAESLQTDGSDKLLGVQLRVDSWQGSLRPELLVERLEKPEAGSTFLECGPDCPDWGPASRIDSGGASAAAKGTRRDDRCMPAAFDLGRLAARDLRDRPGRTSALAQVLATGERALVIGCCLPHMLREARGQIPFADLCEHGLSCAASGCHGLARAEAQTAGVVIAEWDVVACTPALGGARAHIVVADPPYRAEHTALLRTAADEGTHVHLHYGHEERQSTARLLRHLVHPRFAMVCVYRALQETPDSRQDGKEGEILSRAADLAWQEAQVVMSRDHLTRAFEILTDLGLDQPSMGEAKLDAHENPAYVEMEAEYEECARLCLNL
jgi:single-stranded-DNA-specific exonuclease